MPVKVNKLWSNKKFLDLDLETKVLYLYLVTNPSISIVGVICPDLDIVCIQLKMGIDQIRYHTKILIDKGYLYVGKHDGELYFVVIEHFNSLPKSESTVLKVTKELQSLPVSLQAKLKKIGVSVDKKVVEFTKPTVQEVNDYAISMGYLIDGQAFIDYYEETADRYGRKDIWLDSRGKQVKDWKGKLRKVWFKDERKLTPCKGAPKGFEYFFIEMDGELKTPDGWRDGKPYSKNFLINKQLKKTYEERKGSS